MARNGSGVYSLPAAYEATTGETILATQHNTPLEDLEQDANDARPVVAGGTGASSKQNAQTNLSVVGYSHAQTLTSGEKTQARANIGAVIGVDVQAYDADLDDWSGKTAPTGDVVGTDDEQSVSNKAITGSTIDDSAIGGTTPAAGSFTTLTASGASSFTGDVSMSSAPSVNGASFFLDNYLTGLTLSNNADDATNDIDIAAGVAADSGNELLIRLASSITKRLDAAWTVGTGNGGLDTGTVADGTYHVWLIRRSDTGVVDALFSTSATSPTMPTNYDQKRRIGSIVRVSGAILGFYQSGDRFILASHQADRSSNLTGSTETTIPLTVPTGIKVLVQLRFSMNGPTTGSISISFWDPDQTDIATGEFVAFAAGGSTREAVSSEVHIFTNTDGEIHALADSNTATFRLITVGWVDRRGRDG